MRYITMRDILKDEPNLKIIQINKNNAITRSNCKISLLYIRIIQI